MSVSDIQDHFCAPEAAFSEIALLLSLFYPRELLCLAFTGHWPQFFRSRPTSGVRSCADSSPLATAIYRQPNWQRPNGTRSRRASPSIFSMSPKFSMLPNQALPSDKSIRFSTLAAAWFGRAPVRVTLFGLVPAIILARSVSEDPGYPRLRFGLVCAECHPALNQAPELAC